MGIELIPVERYFVREEDAGWYGEVMETAKKWGWHFRHLSEAEPIGRYPFATRDEAVAGLLAFHRQWVAQHPSAWAQEGRQ